MTIRDKASLLPHNILVDILFRYWGPIIPAAIHERIDEEYDKVVESWPKLTLPDLSDLIGLEDDGI